MSLEENKQVALRWIEEALNKGDAALADETFTPDFRLNGIIVGVEGPKRNIALTRTAFPDLLATVEEQIAEGNTVVTRQKLQGTHLGTFNGIAPTGRRIEVSAIIIWHFQNGKVVEDWTELNLVALMQQLGAIPTPTLQ